jgi:type I restriction enzyme S subunit
MRQLLANVLDIVSGQIDPMLQPYCEMPHVGGENIEAGTGHIVGMNTAKELGLTSGKYLFSNEHVLYSKIRPNLNKVALPSSEGICSADIYPLQPKPGVLAREFLAHLLRSADFLAYAQRHSSRTSIPKLNRQSLLGYQALLPPLPEQRRIAEVLDRAEALRAKRRAALAKLDTLTQAIFLDMFGDPKTNPKG